MNINTSIFGSRLSSAYNSLRGDLGAPQTAGETIVKLVERIQTSSAVEDRRTAVLGLKGLSRDWKEDVGVHAFDALLAVLQHDAPHDVESAKAVLETLMQLCEIPERPARDDLGLRHVDLFLQDPIYLHSLLSLVANNASFYPRFYSLQFLSQLLQARPAAAQALVMSAPPPGIEAVLATLVPQSPAGGGSVEMLRNEALLLLPVMLAGNADLQKIVAFSGAFEKLIEIVNAEGGIDGGIVVQDALTAAGSLLRFNVSNQNYFRELELIPSIPPILGFPLQIALEETSPDGYCLQYWPEQKILNTGLVLGLVRMLTGGPGGPNQTAMMSSNVTRSLLELALSSNASGGIKSQTINTLTPILQSSPANQTLLANLSISPLVAIAADEANPNGGFIREASVPATAVLVQSIVEGKASGGLRYRAAGVNMFEAYVNDNDDARIEILSGLSSIESSASTIILSALLDLGDDPYRPLFASLLLAHLVRSSEHAKKLARETTAGDEDEKTSLVQLVVGNLMMASRQQTECANRQARDESAEEEDWTRIMVGYLVLLCTWLWDSPKTVKEFLSESANLQVLIQPIGQTTGVDPLVQGLSAFLLGVCYEFNREPGEITRATLHPILHSRIGPDQFVSRMARLREDPRFKAVQPDSSQDFEQMDEDGLELWFDWAFVDFWKNHYYTIQRSIAVEPDAVRGSTAADDGETASIIMSLRAKLKTQTEQVVQLQAKLNKMEINHHREKETLAQEVETLSEQVATLSDTLAKEKTLLDQSSVDLEHLRNELTNERQKYAGAAEIRTELESLRKDFETCRGHLENTRSALSLAQTAEFEAQRGRKEAEEESQRQFVRAQAAEADAAAARSSTGSKKAKREKTDDRVRSLEAELQNLKASMDSDNDISQLKEQLLVEKERGDELEAKQQASSTDATEALKAVEKQLEKERKRVAELVSEIDAAKRKKEEGEKEHEDLLVLLEDLSEKRKRDKARLKEKGEPVSESEDEDE